MAVDLYEPYTNPITGETFKCISFNEDCYKMEWSVHPKGYVPFEHIHFYQDEIFHVKKGQMKIVIDGQERIINSGSSITVLKGVRHIAFNNTEDVLECDVKYKPGLDYYTFFQCFIGLQKDKNYDKKGQMSVPKMAYFMYKTKCNALARPTTIPAPIFNFVIKFFGVVGAVAGWKKQLKRYTE